MAKKLKEDVKQHLRTRNIPESKLTDDVVDALNAFSKEELDHDKSTTSAPRSWPTTS